MMNQNETPNSPATFLDYAQQIAMNASYTMLGSVPEVRSVAVIVDWNVPLMSDTSSAICLGRGPNDEYVPLSGPLPLFGMMQQANKFLIQLSSRFQQMLQSADNQASTLAQVIHERQEHLDRLNSEIAETERRAAASRGDQP
jgi:hypothetical protein